MSQPVNPNSTNTRLNTPFYSKLQQHLPAAIYNELPVVCQTFNIDGPRRLAHLCGQARHESGNFTATVENLNYSAQGLANTWPNRYAVDPKSTVKVPNELAKRLQRNQVAIANNCYANRMGNGNEDSGDGWLFRGRGFIQLTGKDNYAAFAKSIGVDVVKQPDLVATVYALASAGFFFNNNKLWTICDRGVDAATIELITRRVNGGLHGYDERLKYTQEYHKILTT